MIFRLTSHLFQRVNSQSIIIFLVAAMLVSLIVFVHDNFMVLRILSGHKCKAVKQINPKNSFSVYKTEGYFIKPDAGHYSVYTPYYVQEWMPVKTIKVYGKIFGSKNECLLAFKNGRLIYALFDLSYIYDAVFEAFVRTAREVFIHSLGVFVVWLIMLSLL